MTRSSQTSDVVIVGGGLAGLTAATEAEARGASVTLIDAAVPGTRGYLGGFASFSGAKFSLSPAGSGLVPVVGSQDALIARYAKACALFSDLGFDQFRISDTHLRGDESVGINGLSHRRYHSILLSPDEIDRLLAALTSRLIATRIVRDRVVRVHVDRPTIQVDLAEKASEHGHSLVMAAGRLGSELLSAAGVPEGRGKGLDVGIRLEFDSQAPLQPLRSLGADAKFMAETVRTFCLNSPGQIFHYPALGFKIPGGIVAEPGFRRANVGILRRIEYRQTELDRIRALGQSQHESPTWHMGHENDLGWTEHSREVLGAETIDALNRFVTNLAASGLVHLPAAYKVHYPLLDWHWPVFSQANALASSTPGIIATGDASGHARGLLQAVVMGKLAAEEAVF